MFNHDFVDNKEAVKDASGRILNSDIVFIVRDGVTYSIMGEQLKTTNGWAYYQDNQYTQGSPLVSSTSKTQLTINGLGANTNREYLGSFYDHWVNDKILCQNVGDCFIVRLDWKVQSSANNELFDIIFDIGTDETPIPVIQQTHSFRKGDNGIQRYSKTVSLFCLDTFKQNGCRIFIDTSDSGATLNIFDIAIKIERTFI